MAQMFRVRQGSEGARMWASGARTKCHQLRGSPLQKEEQTQRKEHVNQKQPAKRPEI